MSNSPAGYFDNLLHRVHRRQREEMLRQPAWQIALERVRAFFGPLHLGWRHAGALAVLLVAGIFAIRVAIPDRIQGGSAISDVVASSSVQATAPNITLEPNGAQPLTAQNHRSVQRGPGAPVRFIIDAQPVSYESTQIRF